jgi:hypothetical protein
VAHGVMWRWNHDRLFQPGSWLTNAT